MNLEKTYRNRRVWVVGASSGIGEALALELDALGANVLLSARREEELQRVLSRCQYPDNHIILPLDLADEITISSAVLKVEQEHLTVDLLCNVAGLSQRSLIMDTSLAVHRRIMEVNYFGIVSLTQKVLHSVLAPSGGVMTVSSLVGKFCTPLRSSYSAAKHAITAYMDTLRAELDDTGWQFTTIYPGFIHTNLTYKALLGDGEEQDSMDDAQQNGMDAKECAQKMLKVYASGKAEAFIGGKERFAVYIKRFFPKIFARLIRKAKVV